MLNLCVDVSHVIVLLKADIYFMFLYEVNNEPILLYARAKTDKLRNI